MNCLSAARVARVSTREPESASSEPARRRTREERKGGRLLFCTAQLFATRCVPVSHGPHAPFLASLPLCFPRPASISSRAPLPPSGCCPLSTRRSSPPTRNTLSSRNASNHLKTNHGVCGYPELLASHFPDRFLQAPRNFRCIGRNSQKSSGVWRRSVLCPTLVSKIEFDLRSESFRTASPMGKTSAESKYMRLTLLQRSATVSAVGQSSFVWSRPCPTS